MFNFPKSRLVSRQEFKSNFLRSVTFQLNYNTIEINKELTDLLKNSLTNYNNVQALVEGQVKISNKGFEPQENKLIGIQATSNDGLMNLTINHESIIYIIQGAGYKSFNDFFEKYEKEIELICELLKVKSFNRLGIRKINILPFIIQSEGLTKLDILGMIFNSKLVESMKLIPVPDKHLNHSFNSFHCSVDNYGLKVTYGFTDNKADITKANGVLDIDLFIHSEIIKAEILAYFEKMNEEIFNIFSWSLQPDTINKLNGK